MRIFPRTGQEWLSFLLFPFRAYVVVAPMCLLVWLSVTQGDLIRGGRAEAALPVALGLMICLAVFVLAALIQFIARRRDAALASFWFALAAFLLLYALVLPMCAR
jgi:hypothetical protein